MKIGNLVCAGALVLAGMSVANAKTYHFTLNSRTTVGQSQLKPGEYSVEVKGSNAVIRNDDGSATVTLPVKVQTAKSKFSYTTADTVTEGNSIRLKAIDLGDSDTELDF